MTIFSKTTWFCPLTYLFLPQPQDLSINPLKEESKVRPTHNRRAPDIPPRLDNLLPLEPLPQIKHQMPDTVQRMERKRPRGEELDRALDSKGERAKRRRQRRALEVPADEGGRQVCRRKHVQAAAEGRAREALPDGAAEPGLLLVVDLEVGGDRAV